jgi:transcriptional regulator GlxA family with amidase domain
MRRRKSPRKGHPLLVNERGMNSRLDHITNWEQLAAESGYRIGEMARNSGVSARQLRRYFQKQIGRRPKQWFDELRADAAARQLERGESVKNAAIDQGFKHPQSFTRFFSRIKGTLPKLVKNTSGVRNS